MTRDTRTITASLPPDLRALYDGISIPPIAGAVETVVATTDADTVQRWATKYWMELPAVIYFTRFMKENTTDTIIEVKRDLQGQPGDQLTYTLIRKLTGGGRTGDNQMEGNEEEILRYSQTLTLDQTRNAVLLGGRLSMKRTQWDQVVASKDMLKVWMAETIDDDCFVQFDSSPTRVLFGGNATSTATVGSDDTITLSLINRAMGLAKKVTPKIWPVTHEGRQWYVVVVHTDVAFDLTETSAWQQANREAGPRDDENNNLFSGRIGFWRGSVIHEHEKVPIATNWGSNSAQPGASCLFLGRQAGVFAWGMPPQMWTKTFDYDAKYGICVGAIWEMQKAILNASDFALIALRVYRTNIAAA